MTRIRPHDWQMGVACQKLPHWSHIDAVKFYPSGWRIERTNPSINIQQVHLNAGIDAHGIAEDRIDSRSVDLAITLKAILLNQPRGQIPVHALVRFLVIEARRHIHSKD